MNQKKYEKNEPKNSKNILEKFSKSFFEK